MGVGGEGEERKGKGPSMRDVDFKKENKIEERKKGRKGTRQPIRFLPNLPDPFPASPLSLDVRPTTSGRK